MRRSKILCTLGPASQDAQTLRQMVDAGMDAARLNFSHGSIEDHRGALALVRQVASETGRPLPVLQDLQGPKIRMGDLGEEGVLLEAGSEVTLVAGDTLGPHGELPVTHDALGQDLRAGDSLLLDDGLMRLDVLSPLMDGGLRCKVVVGGQLLSHKGVNLPGVSLSIPSLTEKDRQDLEAGIEMHVDLVALSFVRGPEDVIELRELLRQAGATTPIIAKIEKPEAVARLSEILEVSDGLMVARGDLGVELPPQRVPLLQRQMVEDANAAGKLVIIATQMLDSMLHSPRPTRAEVTDVATAVMQGTDATMLSNETAVGRYPVAAVRMMASIIEEVETGLRGFEVPQEPALIPGIALSASAIGRAAVQAAADLDASCIATFTGSGRTASLVSDYRPRQPILAFTPRPEVYRRMGLLWGVRPVLVEEELFNLDQAGRLASEHARSLGLAGQARSMVLTMGHPSGPDHQTNLLWVRGSEE